MDVNLIYNIKIIDVDNAGIYENFNHDMITFKIWKEKTMQMNMQRICYYLVNIGQTLEDNLIRSTFYIAFQTSKVVIQQKTKNKTKLQSWFFSLLQTF